MDGRDSCLGVPFISSHIRIGCRTHLSSYPMGFFTLPGGKTAGTFRWTFVRRDWGYRWRSWSVKSASGMSFESETSQIQESTTQLRRSVTFGVEVIINIPKNFVWNLTVGIRESMSDKFNAAQLWTSVSCYVSCTVT